MNPILLQAAPATATSPLVQMVPYILMFVIFYFVLLAPMRKQQKKQKQLLAGLKKGDRVVTSGGIHGTIAQVEDQIVWLKITDTVKIKINRSAIAGASGEPDSKESAA
ncbi:MAG TPA: preprotein translocase subunit YajC [Thermoanaerobaculia bacterium]|nr:preprotein translocase subunit YajC [Thermoanaerobaculia bacterium]